MNLAWSNSFLILHLIIANCMANMFQFKSVKDKLYPFFQSYSATDDAIRYTNGGQGEGSATVKPYEMAWVVIVLELARQFTDVYFQPTCLGMLITTMDVLTTCSCTTKPDGSVKSNLVVNPKTIIVNFPGWDRELKTVTNVLLHENCKACKNRSYNDLALLTVAVNVIYRIIQPLTLSYFLQFDQNKLPQNEELRGILNRDTPVTHCTGTCNSKPYRDCFILIMDTMDDVVDFNALSLEKRAFTVWDVQSPSNRLRTKTLVGQSENIFNDTDYKRFPGSPLICRDESNRQAPVGIYVGLFCHKLVDVETLKAACAKNLIKCGDCFPPELTYKTAIQQQTKSCTPRHTFEIVIMFSNLHEWLEENTYELLPQVMVPHHKPSSATYLPRRFVSHLFALSAFAGFFSFK